MVVERQATTDQHGAFEVYYSADPGLGGCFFLIADPTDAAVAYPDSVLLVREDLDRFGDPLGSGVIEIDIIVRAK